jgi:ankyrin repeat domain-containing protein 50
MRSIVVNRVERLAMGHDPPICVGYVYIRYTDCAGLTVRHCLEVLVKQTIEEHPSCYQAALNVYAEHDRLKTRPTEDELLQLLKGFSTLVKAFYFLDALDEAPPEIQTDLVEKLSSIGCKLFITSRPSPEFKARFPDACHFTIVAQDYDLDLLINSKLNSSHALSKVLGQGDASLRDEIVASVKQNCGGM